MTHLDASNDPNRYLTERVVCLGCMGRKMTSDPPWGIVPCTECEGLGYTVRLMPKPNASPCSGVLLRALREAGISVSGNDEAGYVISQLNEEASRLTGAEPAAQCHGAEPERARAQETGAQAPIELPPLPTIDVMGKSRPQIWFSASEVDELRRAAVVADRAAAHRTGKRNEKLKADHEA